MMKRLSTVVNARYVLLALGFAALAAMRFGDGAPVWGFVFAAVAAANGWLALHERRRPQAEAEQPLPDGEQMLRSWHAHRGSLRRWRILGAVATVTAAALLTVEPALGILAAATALVCLYRARRARQDSATLHTALATTTSPADALP